MAINFPTAPATGAEYTFNGKSWKYNGTGWALTLGKPYGREVLAADRTYYVASTGSDSADGLAVGTPFLTVAKAMTVVASLDANNYTVTVQLADGTYTAPIVLLPVLGCSSATLQGNIGAMSNVVLSVGAGQAGVSASSPSCSMWAVKYMKLQGGDIGLKANNGAFLSFGFIDFGVITYHILAVNNSAITCVGNYSITGAAAVHLFMQVAGAILIAGRTITITGTPAFASAYVNGQTNSVCSLPSNTYSGSATGVRYNLTNNSIAATGGATLPGNAAGTTATGGQYA